MGFVCAEVSYELPLEIPCSEHLIEIGYLRPV